MPKTIIGDFIEELGAGMVESKLEHVISDAALSAVVHGNGRRKAKAMPALIRFKCAPYSSLKERVLPVRLSALTGRDELGITLRIVKHDEILEDITHEFKSLLESNLDGSDIKTYIGSV